MGKPKVIAFFLDDEIAPDDPYRAVKLRARDIDAAAEILGQVAREAGARARAARLDEAAGLFADPAFNPLETGDAAAAAGLSEADIDAASYVALVLRKVELDGEAGGYA
jgi:hypothetical protein